MCACVCVCTYVRTSEYWWNPCNGCAVSAGECECVAPCSGSACEVCELMKCMCCAYPGSSSLSILSLVNSFPLFVCLRFASLPPPAQQNKHICTTLHALFVSYMYNYNVVGCWKNESKTCKLAFFDSFDCSSQLSYKLLHFSGVCFEVLAVCVDSACALYVKCFSSHLSSLTIQNVNY